VDRKELIEVKELIAPKGYLRDSKDYELYPSKEEE